MWRDQGAAAVYCNLSVSFERISRVVKFNVKEQSQEQVGEPINYKLEGWITDDGAIFDKSTAENTVISFVQIFPVAHDVAAVIRLIRHHNHRSVTLHTIKTPDNGPSVTVLGVILNWP